MYLFIISVIIFSYHYFIFILSSCDQPAFDADSCCIQAFSQRKTHI